MHCKSTVSNLEPDEVKANSSATGLHAVAKDERKSNAPQAETPATRMPKATWAWAESSRRFDWMDWHSPSALPTPTDFDL
jgi:hypothetical protein